jgi:glycerol-3-phosphate dehydrogenase (NAD(P)+)
MFQRIAPLFRGTSLVVEHTQDRLGIAWAAVLKNVYAMLFGVADELGLGDNTRGFLTVAAMRELQALLRRLGALSTAPYQLAGLGDLITTATSAGSHHHELGRRLARGERGLAGEGVHTLAMLERYRSFDTADCPLLQVMAEGLREPEQIRERLWRCIDPASRP